MNMTPVQSDAVEALGHDGHDLHVTYKGGKTYVHPGVSTEKYNQLLLSPSKGQFLNVHIRKQHPGRLK
jgi:hypothetical protein